MSLWRRQHTLSQIDTVMRMKLDDLIELIRLNPAVRSCVQRMICEVVPTEVAILEKNKPLKPELNSILGPYFSQFLAESIEMAYMCGFVVFVLKKHKDIKLPHLMPLGSFTWSVQVCSRATKKRKREDDTLFRYDVQPVHPDISIEDLYVFNFHSPRVQMTQCLSSPIDALCNSLRNIRSLQIKIDEVLKWNSEKHITTSERVDIPKDQTTDGLSLLDDFRRYCVGDAQHTGLSKHYMMLNGPRGSMARSDPSQIRNAWIKNLSFDTQEEEHNTKIHVLPPNTDMQELGHLDMNINLQDLQQLFQNEVFSFFQFTPASDISAQKNNAQYVSQTEVKAMRQISNFAKRLLMYASACAFDVEENTVRIDLPQPSGMNIGCADDIKKLSEAGTLLPGDSLQLRKRLMRNV